MEPHRCKVQHHYDKIATSTHCSKTADEAVHIRTQGEMYPLKKFHNMIKTQCLTEFVSIIKEGSSSSSCISNRRNGEISLLDLCCGRGGDIAKWCKLGIHVVTAIDVSLHELKEAIRRQQTIQQGNPKYMNTRINFYQTECLGVDDKILFYTAGTTCTRSGIEEEESSASAVLLYDVAQDKHVQSIPPSVACEPYDIVTCFFAIQYFFDKEQTAQKLLKTIANNLKRGGYFIGTCPDGKSILSLLGKQKGEVNYDIMKIKQLWLDDVYGPFGSQYHFSLADTVTQDVQGSINTEFLVFENVLMKLARSVGLEPITDWPDSCILNDVLEPTCKSKHGLFRQFRPKYNIRDRGNILKQASRLNVAFAFKKR